MDLDEHPSRAFAAQWRATAEKLVGALDRLDAKDQALLHDYRLADIESAQRASNLQTVPDIGRRLLGRTNLSERTLGRQRTVEQLVRGDNPKPLLLQLVDNRRQQAVITKRPVTDAREELGRAPIGPQRRERRPPDAAGKDQFAHVVFAQ